MQDCIIIHAVSKKMYKLKRVFLASCGIYHIYLYIMLKQTKQEFLASLLSDLYSQFKQNEPWKQIKKIKHVLLKKV